MTKWFLPMAVGAFLHSWLQSKGYIKGIVINPNASITDQALKVAAAPMSVFIPSTDVKADAVAVAPKAVV